MDAQRIFGRILLFACLVLVLNFDYLTVINSVYQKIFQNGSLWTVPSDTDVVPKVKRAPQKQRPRDPLWTDSRVVRIPGFHRGGAGVFLNLDEQIAEDTIEKLGLFKSKFEMLGVLKNYCLPKLVCEMSATPHKSMLSNRERELLVLIRQSSITIHGSVTSKYHYAAHMGQLISGIEGQGCHNFYPSCPFQSLQILRMLRRTQDGNSQDKTIK